MPPVNTGLPASTTTGATSATDPKAVFYPDGASAASLARGTWWSLTVRDDQGAEVSPITSGGASLALSASGSVSAASGDTLALRVRYRIQPPSGLGAVLASSLHADADIGGAVGDVWRHRAEVPAALSGAYDAYSDGWLYDELLTLPFSGETFAANGALIRFTVTGAVGCGLEFDVRDVTLIDLAPGTN